jgi:TonB family protein
VIIKVIIHADGHVELVDIIKSDPNFDEAVKAIIGQLRYRPAVYSGQPLAVFRNIRFPFKLK